MMEVDRANVIGRSWALCCVISILTLMRELDLGFMQAALGITAWRLTSLADAAFLPSEYLPSLHMVHT